MKKKIDDYLHFYLGFDLCGLYGKDQKTIFELWKVKWGRKRDVFLNLVARDGKTLITDGAAIKFKPILRPLTDITQEECDIYNSKSNTLYSLADLKNQIIQEASTTQYLLSRGFDLFGLIEEGLAIDKTTLPKS